MPMRRELYADNWEAISAYIRFERADGKCEEEGCGAPHGAYIVRDRFHPEKWRLANEGDLLEGLEPHAIKVILTVAHLDHDPSNNDPSNLKALCQLHHLRLDKGQHAANAKATRTRKKAERLQAQGQLTLNIDYSGD